jgi:hypothetical protein
MNTPRTDTAVCLAPQYATPEYVHGDFARELEREIASLRGATARLCRAVSRHMMPDEPTPEDRMELREAFDTASSILQNSFYS